MPNYRDALTPVSLTLLQQIADSGSFAAAARALNMVPSALTYRVQQIEEALDVLLFDRSSRQAKLTEAGTELLREGAGLLAEVDAIANRIKRVATGWEAELTIAVDSIIDRVTVMELCANFFSLNPPTRLKLRSETLSGTLEALTSGEADIALGVVMDNNSHTGLHRESLGTVGFVFSVAPHHPLAEVADPLPDSLIRQYRAAVISDSTRSGRNLSIGLLPGQDVFTVPDMPSKVDAQVRGMGIGFLPTCLAQPYIDTGRLIVKRVDRAEHKIQSSYAWRKSGRGGPGKALAWWLEQLKRPVTRAALLGERCRIQ
ncbi:MAG: LysR family transcriptional regulator [Burkholderiaceae bacterium]|nr:LysR family transcriptional regulator [Burkholderiaceae bacterium]